MVVYDAPSQTVRHINYMKRSVTMSTKQTTVQQEQIMLGTFGTAHMCSTVEIQVSEICDTGQIDSGFKNG